MDNEFIIIHENTQEYKRNINCNLCNFVTKEKENIYQHYEEEHSEFIPKGWSGARYYFQQLHGRSNGTCIICGKETGWNETTNKPHRFCDNPRCKEIYIKTVKDRMKSKYGKEHLLNDPNMQQKMMFNRGISGVYIFRDGGRVPYMGSYEMDFLQFLDIFLGFSSKDIMECPHYFDYMYEGNKKIYIPDYYIPTINTIVEIKDGGENPNTHSKIQTVDKVKEKLKDEIMKKQRTFNYIKITNKNYTQFLNFLLQLKNYDDPIETKRPLFIISEHAELLRKNILTESSITKSNIRTPEELLEWMKHNISYGFVDRNNDIYTYDSEFNYHMDRKYRLQSPNELYNSKFGVCWDQVEFERYFFEKFKIEHVIIYIEQKNSNHSTHTFLIYLKDNKYYWFENSYDIYRGIHGPYDSMYSIIEDVHNKMYNDEKDNGYEFHILTKPKYGIGVREYMNHSRSNKNLSESYIFNENDLYINLNDWKKEKYKNILFITGLSGSGKTTLAKELATKHNASLIELDGFAGSFDSSEIKFVHQYYKENGYLEVVRKFKWNNIKDTNLDFNTEFIKFFNWLNHEINEKYSDKLFIIEGMQIFRIIPDKVRSKPLIIKGTSMLKSMYQQFKRDGDEKNFIDKLIKDFSWGSEREKSLSQFKKSLKECSEQLNEQSNVKKIE